LKDENFGEISRRLDFEGDVAIVSITFRGLKELRRRLPREGALEVRAGVCVSFEGFGLGGLVEEEFLR
jgi:hypothetical protein